VVTPQLPEREVLKENKDGAAPNGASPESVRPLLTFFYEQYAAKYARAYVPHWAKEGKLMKGALAVLGAEPLKEQIRRFMLDQDAFLDRAGRTVGVFVSRLNRHHPKSQQEKIMEMARG